MLDEQAARVRPLEPDLAQPRVRIGRGGKAGREIAPAPDPLDRAWLKNS